MSRLIDIDDPRNCYIGMDGEYETYNIDTNVIAEASSVQPDIIRCKDCKHKGTKNCVANAWTTIFGVTVKDDFYCGLAERRTDETD